MLTEITSDITSRESELKQDYRSAKRETIRVTGGSCVLTPEPILRQRGKSKMKTVKVAAAVITASNKNGEKIIFATQRGYGEFKDGWEFPGGKVEPGETPQAALKREIMEELETEIEVGDLIETIEYDYPTFHLSMDCFWAEIVKGDLVLREHEAAKWLTKEELESVDWLPADLGLVEKVRDSIPMRTSMRPTTAQLSHLRNKPGQ